MGKENKEALQVTKEIIVKFIETQRISPSNFAEHFPAIYKNYLKKKPERRPTHTRQKFRGSSPVSSNGMIR